MLKYFSLRRRYVPRLEWLEDRLAPAVLAVPALTFFDPASGWLAVRNASADVTVESDGELSVTLAGQLHSSKPTDPAFDPALAGASALSLHGVRLTGGAALTLNNVTTAGDLSVQADGGVTLAGTDRLGGRLTVEAATLDVQGGVAAEALNLNSTGLLNVEASGWLAAARIEATADYFVNVGQIQADGATGGGITVSTRNYLNAGTLGAQGTGGAGGTVRISFSASYIDTAAAETTVDGSGGAGSGVTIDGGTTGRLFSSGRISATGADGGRIDLFGQSIALVTATVDASGTTGQGGDVRIGGGFQGLDATAANSQTVQVTTATTVRAAGASAGGSVDVWSQTSTDFSGTISARGGQTGGSIEVSSHGQLNYAGQADAGKAGTLLLDPKDLVVSGTANGFPQFNLVNPGSGGTFGTQVQTLSTGNVVVTDPTAINNAGVVYLFNGQTGALLSTLTGSNSGTNGDQVGSGTLRILGNGNFAVASPKWSGGAGAVTWGSGTVGVSGVVAAANSLTGSAPTDNVGGFVLAGLGNGNYVVVSPKWNGSRGAATWGSGTAAVSGVISVANSLVGSTANDQVGSVGFAILSNDNYVVISQSWNGGVGATTWGSGTAGVRGVVSATNSLVGSIPGDGMNQGLTELTNGKYVVDSPNWNGGVGAVTWGSGTTGVSGVIAAANSLTGSTPGDMIGNHGIYLLSNGNYVVLSSKWNGFRGAATWESGTAAVSGVVTPANSLVGSTANDQVGERVTPLTNGNYVVDSPVWNGVMGAVTWGNGLTGTSGVVFAANSLVGSVAGDNVGANYVWALSNGNYVVQSPYWNGARGAATWGNGLTGVTGVISAANSLVGSTANDQVGRNSLATLGNGNYVVDSPNWNGGMGATTWGNGLTGIVGVVTTTNSFTGSAVTDQVGRYGITYQSSGNYVVDSPNWNGNLGAVTWGSGLTGGTGVVSAANSLVGSTAGDMVGSGRISILSNGNYVVSSPLWNGSRGAATWGSGTTGIHGVIDSGNSLVGFNAADYVGSLGVVALSNGNYVVASGGPANVGYATWVDGLNGTTLDGQNLLFDQNNSVVGSAANGGTTLTLQQGPVVGSFLAAFPAENGGRVTVGLPDPNALTFALAPALTLTVSPVYLTNSLKAGTSVILQATEDITINSPISVTPAGSPGNLTLQAGRNLNLNAGINLAGGTLTLDVSGTPGNDTFTFTAGSPAQYSLNGSSHLLPAGPVVVHFVGNGGSDSATLTGAGPNNFAALLPTDTSLSTGAIVVDAANCVSVAVNAGGGNATANFGLASHDTFIGRPDYSTAIDTNYSATAVGFAHAHGFAVAGSGSTAFLVTSAGASDILGGVPAYSFVQGAGYDSYAIGFGQVNGYSGGAGSLAYLGMSPGHDTFFGLPNYSAVTGTGYAVYAVGFHQTQGYSGGINSTAILETSATSNDAFVGTSTYSFVQGGNYLAYALGFSLVQAYAGGANSVAYLQRFASADFYGSVPGSYSEAKGAGYDNFAVNFSAVVASSLHS